MDNKRILVVAPHPDDETLGCGATLLKYIQKGFEVHWLIVTKMTESMGFSKERIDNRLREIEKVENEFCFKKTHFLNFETTKLDTLSNGDIISAMMKVFQEVKPTIVYTPFRNDVHSDHKVTFDSVMACSKWFRCKEVKEVYAYETVSETDFSNSFLGTTFIPNVYENVESTFDKKLKILDIYSSELSEFPFPRSIDAITALAKRRGAESGYKLAESFMLVKISRE